MRILSIRLIAVYFLVLGSWNIFRFLREILLDDSANITRLLIGVILFLSGYNLFFLKEMGRKLTLGILGINILQILVTTVITIPKKNFAFSLTGLGGSFHSDSISLYMVLIIPWLFLQASCGVLLLQNKTKSIFRNK